MKPGDRNMRIKTIFLIMIFFMTLCVTDGLSAEYTEGLKEETISIPVQKDRKTEAVKTAYVTGMVVGYTSTRYELQEGIIDFYLIEDKYSERGVDLLIRVRLDSTTNTPRLTIEGWDAGYGAGSYRLAPDMERIADAVKECCGIN